MKGNVNDKTSIDKSKVDRLSLPVACFPFCDRGGKKTCFYFLRLRDIPEECGEDL